MIVILLNVKDGAATVDVCECVCVCVGPQVDVAVLIATAASHV